jgi:glycopeptide antibiotics resistance protein
MRIASARIDDVVPSTTGAAPAAVQDRDGLHRSVRAHRPDRQAGAVPSAHDRRPTRASSTVPTPEVDVLDGRLLSIAALPAAVAIGALRLGWPRTLVALVALGHLVVLANVALFPIPIDPILATDGRAAAVSTGMDGLNLVPFATIGPVLRGTAPGIAARIALLNLFVLTPAGIYLPLLSGRLRSWRALPPLVLVGGAAVEAAQLAISLVLGFRYRAIDIDDVILNAAGLAIGWLVTRALARWWTPAMSAGRHAAPAQAPTATRSGRVGVRSPGDDRRSPPASDGPAAEPGWLIPRRPSSGPTSS